MMILPYEDAVAEIKRLWQAGVDTLEQARSLAIEQGFFADVGELDYATMHVDFKGGPPLQLTSQDPRDRLRELVIRLDREIRFSKERPRGLQLHNIETWIICPRKHAEAHASDGLRIPDVRGMSTDYGRELFRMVNRFHDGPDLVYAIAPAA